MRRLPLLPALLVLSAVLLVPVAQAGIVRNVACVYAIGSTNPTVDALLQATQDFGCAVVSIAGGVGQNVACVYAIGSTNPTVDALLQATQDFACAVYVILV